MRIALYEPDIPQNTGTVLRLTACLGIEAHIIEPTGFPSSDRAFRRAGMDYLDHVALTRHMSWTAFEDWRRAERARLVLFTTTAEHYYLDYAFETAFLNRCDEAERPVVAEYYQRATGRTLDVNARSQWKRVEG